MFKTNSDRLVRMSIAAKPSMPDSGAGETVGHDGIPFVGPRTGGICYNVQVGDLVFGWEGDHIEPGVSTRAYGSDGPMHKYNAAYNLLACIGNKVKVLSGDAKEHIGFVTGKHGGSERVLISFPKDTMKKLSYDDKLMVNCCGQGLHIKGFSNTELRIMNIDPFLFKALGIEVSNDHKIRVPVSYIIPPELMGSGIGSTKVGGGDYDITTQDYSSIQELDLHSMRLGDVVAIMNHDNVHGRCFKKGFISIGIVVHCDSVYAGHGPGVTVIMSARNDILFPVFDEHKKPNIADVLKIGRYM
jgi:hypothetical protein